MELIIIDKIPTWKELMDSKVGTIYKYKNSEIIRLNNFRIEIIYYNAKKKDNVICFSKEQFKSEIELLKKL